MGVEKGTCYLVGHAHLDAAWLWTRDETIRICRDTFSSILDLMERYPAFHFTQSSAQYYEWMEEHYPEIFKRIKKRAQEGRWEVVGGMQIEPDCNLPSGESLVRQILHGKRYFREKFGIDVKVAWLPDSFGFPWTLPQILKKSGIDYFLTSKLNYRTTLPFPHNLFWWRSPDGSQILACQTIGNYNTVDPKEVVVQSIAAKRLFNLDDVIVLYGYGDHGGGPTSEVLDKMIELSKHENAPHIRFSTAKIYFDRISEVVAEKALPVVNDELYLKSHRGTYTTQAKAKRNNRKAETLLESAEKFSSIARMLGFMKYPKESLRKAWKKLLFNQFHDILAGSSIPEVYEESERDFEEVFDIAERSLSDALKAIAEGVDTSGEGTSILVFNPLAWTRDAVIKVALKDLGGTDSIEVLDLDGNMIPSQVTGGELLFIAEGIPSMGYKEFRVVPKKKEKLPTGLSALEDEKGITLENRFYRVSIDKGSGLLISIYDKVNAREVLDGRGDILQVYEDGPSVEDAWNINLGALTELDNAIEVKLIEEGPVRAVVRVKHVYHQKGRPDSTFVQDIILHHKIPWIEFKLRVDWHAKHRLAKVAFPLALRSEWATYEIPYGFIRRRDPSSLRANPTERSKWEVPGQKWIDYTDGSGDYGISLLNDCKYGFDVKGNVMRMTLLRSPCHPDALGLPMPEMPTDQGEHLIGYALYPHKGDWREGETVKRGYEFNCPPLFHIEPSHPGKLPKAHSFVEVRPENIVLTAFKGAEDSEAMILRFYEVAGSDTQAEIALKEPPLEAWETDLLEREMSRLPIEDRTIRIEVGHWEIKTIKIKFPSR